MPNAQFFNPQNELEAKRRMRMAKMLQESSQTPAAPAGTVVAQSPWAALARGIMGGVGQYQERLADEMTSNDATDRQKFLQSAVQQYGNDPKMLAQALLTQPSTADAGLGLYGDAIKGDQMTAYQSAMLGLQNRKLDESMKPENQKISIRDEMRMAKSEEGAQAAQGVTNLMNEAKGILGKYETNKAAPIIGKFGQFTNAIGMAGPETKAKVTDYESMDKISKDLGIQTLKQFGGNDTDKELQVAIQTNIDPSATVESNMRTVNRKIAAANILQQKPDFEAQWVAKNGGLNRLDRETGKSFQSEWMKVQRDMWANDMGSQVQGKTAPLPPQNDEEAAFLRSLDNAPKP